MPDSLQRALRAILELDESQTETLLSVLKTEHPSLNTAALASRIASELEIPRRTAGIIVGVLTGNYTAKIRSDRSAAALAEVNVRQFNRSSGEAEKLSEEEIDRLTHRLTELLSIEAFDAAAKASDVAYDHERLFQGARVLTDMRPAYVAEPPEPPAAAVVIHMLKIDYLEAGEEKEFFVALDGRDVDDLIRTLEHAKAKTESLESVLAKAGLRYVDVK